MIIEYNEQQTFTKSIDLVDAGNTSLRLENENGIEYYIIVQTAMGKTSILKFGPVLSDFDTILDEFFVSFQKIDYKEISILKAIKNFINDPKKKIIDAEEITEVEALKSFPNISAYFIGGE